MNIGIKNMTHICRGGLMYIALAFVAGTVTGFITFGIFSNS